MQPFAYPQKNIIGRNLLHICGVDMAIHNLMSICGEGTTVHNLMYFRKEGILES